MQELRALCFEPAELARALLPYLKAKGEALPRGTVDGIELSSDPEFACALTILDDYGQGHRKVLDQAVCAAALIAHCMDRRVPLPANASKRLEAVGGQAVLTLWVDERPSLVRRTRATTRPQAGSAAPGDRIAAR